MQSCQKYLIRMIQIAVWNDHDRKFNLDNAELLEASNWITNKKKFSIWWKLGNLKIDSMDQLRLFEVIPFKNH